MRVLPVAPFSLSCCPTSSCSVAVSASIHSDRTGGWMLNQTYFILFTNSHYKVSIPVRTAIEASTFCAPIYKDIRSSRNENNVITKGERQYKVYLDFTKPWIIEFRQQANVGDLPFQTNQPTRRADRYVLRKRKFSNLASYLHQPWSHTCHETGFFDCWSLFADAAHANESIEHESSENKLHLCLFAQTVLLFMYL